MAARKIEDAGEKIGGARKDWRDHAMGISDLAHMTPEERATTVKKDHVWPKPDYAALVKARMEPEAAAAIKVIRDRMAVLPPMTRARTAEEAYENFIRMTEAVRDDLLACRTLADVRGANSRLTARHGGKNVIVADPKVSAVWFSVYAKKFAPFQLDLRDVTRVLQMVLDGFPSPKAPWLRGVQAVFGPAGRMDVFKDGAAFGTFDSLEAAHAALEKAYGAKSGDTKPTKKDGPRLPPPSPHLDDIRREDMTDHRGGADVSPEDFIDAFRFRAVEFGNWVPDSERQKMLNLAFDATMDLAEVLGWEPRDMSLGGRMAAAFGARGGSGKGAAHYEPGRAVYNFTRFRGAGTQAHEFGHALDHFLCLGSEAIDKGGIPYASGGRGRWKRPIWKILEHRGDEVAMAWHDGMNALRKRRVTKGEAVAAAEAEIAKVDLAISRQLERAAIYEVEGSAYLEPLLSAIETNRERKVARETTLSHLSSRHVSEDFGSFNTSFLRNAVMLSGPDGYHARPTELFARAFESFVFDELEARGSRSEYLVAGVEEDRYEDTSLWKGNPYPTGDERRHFGTLIRKAVDLTLPALEEVREYGWRRSSEL